jgi:hypothetical protein
MAKYGEELTVNYCNGCCTSSLFPALFTVMDYGTLGYLDWSSVLRPR